MITSKEYAEKLASALSIENGGITVSKKAYAEALGPETYSRLSAAHNEQLVIDQGIGLAVAAAGYEHIKANPDVASVPVKVSQYGETDKVNDVNRTVSGVVRRDTRNPGTGELSPGDLTIKVEVKIKASGFKAETKALADKFFG